MVAAVMSAGHDAHDRRGGEQGQAASSEPEGGCHEGHVVAAVAAGLGLVASTADAASTDVFNGRIAFTSFRTDPQVLQGDLFSISSDGTGLRQLTSDPEDDAQADWHPDGQDIAYRIRKPGFSRHDFSSSSWRAPGPSSDPVRPPPPEPPCRRQPSAFV